MDCVEIFTKLLPYFCVDISKLILEYSRHPILYITDIEQVNDNCNFKLYFCCDNSIDHCYTECQLSDFKWMNEFIKNIKNIKDTVKNSKIEECIYITPYEFFFKKRLDNTFGFYLEDLQEFCLINLDTFDVMNIISEFQKVIDFIKKND